jgi:putative membrane protein
MGVGFAVSRFGLFLREMRSSELHQVVQPTGFSAVAGVGLVALGVIVNEAAVVHHVRTVRELQDGSWMPGISRNAVVLASLLAVGGVGLGVYLLLIR